MRHTTRRRFLAAGGSAAGAAACAGGWPGLFAGMGTALAADAGPSVKFPAAARGRIAIASDPFRDFIARREGKSGSGKVELEELVVDGAHSPYAMDSAERELAVASSKEWIDAAVTIGSPSVRTHIPAANDAKPDVERTAESLKRVAEYGAAKNVVVHLENDDAVSEDPFFIVKVIEKVNSAWLRALPDFGNSVAAHDDDYAYKGVAGMFTHAYGISHVKETEEGEQGKIAHVDFAKTFGIAKQHGYKGYFSMEWDSPGDPYTGTAGLIEKTLKNLA